MYSHTGYQSNDVRDVSLECIQQCLEKKDAPFITKRFVDKESIELLLTAVNKAEKMSGFLNYGALFTMTITLNDGSEEQYHLNISNSEKSQEGLLVKLSDTAQGYSIPEETSERLKHFIYKPHARLE